jgi:hypothetical protein
MSSSGNSKATVEPSRRTNENAMPPPPPLVQRRVVHETQQVQHPCPVATILVETPRQPARRNNSRLILPTTAMTTTRTPHW